MKILALLLVVLAASTSNKIEIPPIFDSNPISLKLGALKQIQQPDFSFSRVYQRSVQQIENDSTSNFPPCKQNKPEVEFDIVDQVVFSGIPQRPTIIYNFDNIRYSQFLLDIYYENLTIYLMFKNGRAAVVVLESETRVSQSEMIDVVGIENEPNLQIGYFIKVGGDALFINSDYVIRMKDRKAIVVEGYLGHKEFESVIGIDDGYFVVMDQTEGLIVYQYDGDKVTNVSAYGADFLSPTTSTIQLEDVTYHSSHQILILLDYHMGAQTYKVSKQSNFTLTKAQPISNQKSCHLMYLHSNNLYISCRKMSRFNLQNFPEIEETKLPFPNVEIKQIYEIDNIVAFVGRNSFSILYLDRVVNYYEDGNLDRLLFYKDTFISASQAGIDIGKVKIIKPYITCNTDTQKYVGVTKLVFKTIAECNSSYFQKYQINSTQISNIQDTDVCIYTVYRSASYWKVGQINVLPYIGVSLAILFILFLLVILFCFKNIKIQRVQSLLDEFASSNNSESAKHQQFEDEMEGGQGVVESDKDLKPNMDEDLNGKEVPQHMHDIS